MGDRTDCTLQLIGVVTDGDYEVIKTLVEQETSGSTLDPDIPGYWHFDEVNYGNFDYVWETGDLKTYCADRGLTLAWSWGSGGGYGPGVDFFLPEGKEKSFSLSSDQGQITVECEEPLGRLLEAQKFQKLWRKGLTINPGSATKVPYKVPVESLIYTAACLWEACLEAGPAAVKERLGTVEFRKFVVSLAEQCEQLYHEVQPDCEYDWDWCPEFISQAVDWELLGVKSNAAQIMSEIDWTPEEDLPIEVVP